MLLQNEQRQVTTQRIDPKIIMANSILQLSSMELNQSIETELMENPALVILEDTTCAGDCIDPSTCPFCPLKKKAESETAQHFDALDSGDQELEYEPLFGGQAVERDEEYDVLGNLEAEMTLQEHLSGLLRSAVPAEDFWIGEYLIYCLDERGWLGDTPENIAQELNAPIEEVLRLLQVLQSLDPPGVGAQTLQECLLLQIRFLRDEEQPPASARINALAEQMVRDHFDHIAPHRYAKLARLMSVTVDEAKQTIEYIKTRLNPFPA